MANSGTVTAGSAALASQYNNLRDDVLNITTGHTHTGASENGAKVAATGVSSGTAALNAVLTADGSGGASFLALAAAGADVQEFTTSGSWVKPAGKTAVYVLAIGGGGGGASGNCAQTTAEGGVGGNGGNTVARWILASSLAGTVAVTIGAGGAGGTSLAASSSFDRTGVEGATGGQTSLGTAVVATGGYGGYPNDPNVEGSNLKQYIPTGSPTVWGAQQSSQTSAAGTSVATVSPYTATAANYGLQITGNIGGIGKGRASLDTFWGTAGGGGGGSNGSSNQHGGAAGRGFGIRLVPAAAGGTGNITPGGVGENGGTVGIGNGGAGGGGKSDTGGGTAGTGGNGYLGGGGGGGGGAAHGNTRSVRAGNGGAGGGGYMLVISV